MFKHVLFSCLLFLSPLLCADTSLWVISAQGQKLYIGGTIHVLSAEDYPLPAAFDRAYQQAQKLVFETDIAEVGSVAFQQQMMAAMVYSDGRSLRAALQPATYRELEAYCAETGFPLDNIQRFKPGMVSMILTIDELGRLGMADTGVDMYFYEKAVSDGKTLGELETPLQQMQFITSMGLGREDELILNTLRDMKELPMMMSALKTAWREGNREQLVDLGMRPLQQDFPALYEMLLVDRNREWLPALEAMLKTPEVEFVLVGALHLVGEDGLLDQLARRGYRVEPFIPNEAAQ